MKQHLKSWVWGMCAIGAFMCGLPRAEAKPNGRPPRIYLPGETKPAEKPVTIGMPSEVGFLRDTIYYARNAQWNGGNVPKEPAVFTTISIVALEPSSSLGGKAPDRTKVWYSYGPLRPSSDTDSLEGKLPLFSNFGDASNPFSVGDNMTLGVVIKQNGRTSLHFQIAGRNRLGKGPEEFQPETDQEMLLTTTRDFGGQKSLITISLTKTWIEKQAAPVAVEKKPIGVKYEVSSKFVFTNTEDGAGDNAIEVLNGKISLNDEVRIDTYGGHKAGDVVYGETFVVVRYFNDPKTNRLKVRGNIKDYDDYSKNDPIWEQDNVLLLGNIVMNKGTRTLTGDGESESGDLVITVKKIADIY